MTLLDFKRLADAPPPVRELLVVDDKGGARVWRSNGPAIGRFAGSVTDLAGLRTAIEAAGAARPDEPELPPDAVVEIIEAGGQTARFAAGRPVAGAWGALVEACRATLGDIVASPLAAVGITVAEDGRVQLEHQGPEALSAELASLAGRVTLWRDGAIAAEGRLATPDGGRLSIGQGWSMDLAAEGLDDAGPGILVAEVTFVADDDGVFVPVRLTASRSR